MATLLDNLARPIVQAPMAGGPSTPRLAAAVSGAGGLGFLAAGYKAPADLQEEIAATRAMTPSFGVNVFVPGPAAEQGAVDAYVEGLAGEAERYGVAVGEPRHSDDGWEAKLALLAEDPVPVVSFTFGCPSAETVGRLREVGSEVWVTITSVEEGRLALGAGADALVVQGAEAGAHQGSFEDRPEREALGLLALLQLATADLDAALVASGGIATGAALAAVLAAGASAAQLGTAFLLCPEAGTAEAHREAIEGGGATRFTRAFTGRRARGIVNRFLAEHEGAPAGYPEIHYATAPIRAAARAAGDPEGLNLWAGQTHPLARAEPAADLVARLDAEARCALAAAAGR